MLIKLGELQLKPDHIYSDLGSLPNVFASVQDDNESLVQFRKTAEELKKIAPRAKDFLYFSAIMMTSAEASALNDDGSIKKDAFGRDVSVSWDKNNDTWRWVSSDPRITPYKNSNCFVAGTKIMMSDGSVKNIEDVQIGDQVITHRNHAKAVTQTFAKQYDGDLVELKIVGNPPLFVTPEHPFYVASCEVNGQPAYSRKKITERVAKLGRVPDFTFRAVKDLHETDVCLSPVLTEIKYDFKNLGTSDQRMAYITSADLLTYGTHSIRQINKQPFSGQVYNIEVQDDHSYVANGVICHNCDIFPEEELIKAHKKWIGRPLCLDHQSNSVDMIRGIIVDTFYDKQKKRIIALCALDKINYPDLARKISTGVCASVSMGTGVGKAICTDCGRVARVEADFCDHMRHKNGYGEINIDLNPIELSIVVNGADPQAKIRYIVAAADSIARYVNMKQNQIKTADESGDIALSKQVVEGLEQAQQMLKDLQDKVDQLKQHEEIEQKEQTAEPTDTKTPDLGSAADGKVEAARQDSFKQIVPMIDNIMKSLAQLDNTLKKDAAMEKNSYFQGGGGVNEPSKPGTPKYPKEEADKIRDTQDKQMVGAPPFTGVGPVDGLYPGDEQKKRELLRIAEAEQRELKRKAALKQAEEALQKGAYWQGGGGLNEPSKPGTPKYPVDPTADKDREKEDKQMVGAPPFPSVGKVDGLYGNDLETKKKLLRAKLNAKFIKAATADGRDNLGDSRWQVYADGKLVLTATVNEITGNRAEMLYSGIATKEFGQNLLAMIKTEGFEKAAAALNKGAQAIGGAAPAPASPLPGGAGTLNPGTMGDPFGGTATAAPPGEAPAGPADAGKSGNPKETISDISNKLSNLAADLAQANDALNEAPANELANFDQLTGGTTATGEPGVAPEGAPTLATMITMQKKLGEALRLGVRELLGTIKENHEDLKMASLIVSDSSIVKDASAEKRQSIKAMVTDSMNDALRTLAEGRKLMGSVVKYARGTDNLVKRASAVIQKRAQKGPFPEAQKQNLPGDPFGKNPLGMPGAAAPKPTAPAKPAATPAKKNPSDMTFEELTKQRGPTPARDQMLTSVTKGVGGTPTGSAQQLNPNTGAMPPAANADDGVTSQIDIGVKDHSDEKPAQNNATDKNDLKCTLENGKTQCEGTPQEIGAAMKAEKTASFDLTTKEGRTAYRAKLAEKGLQFTDMIGKAHPKGGFTTQLDVKPQGDLAKVETIIEQNAAMMDIAQAPPKVRKAAEEIQRYVVAGKINPEKDFDALIAQGLDPAAIKYWKQYWGQAKDGGSEFASQLVADYANKKTAEDQSAYKTKFARACSLAYEMADKGLCAKDAGTIKAQTDDIMGWNEASFESVKKVIAQNMTKKASAVPSVGLIGIPDIHIPAPETDATLRTQLEACFTKSRY